MHRIYAREHLRDLLSIIRLKIQFSGAIFGEGRTEEVETVIEEEQEEREEKENETIGQGKIGERSELQ